MGLVLNTMRRSNVMCDVVLEIVLGTTGDRSFLIGGLKSAIFDLLGDLSKSDDLNSISISILEKRGPVLMRHAYVLQLLELHPRFWGKITWI